MKVPGKESNTMGIQGISALLCLAKSKAGPLKIIHLIRIGAVEVQEHQALREVLPDILLLLV